MTDIPATMRALVLHAYDFDGYDSLTLEERRTPRPGKGEVLVRMAASPINPADLAFMHGLYGVKKPLPVVPGVEGCGVVVATGGGLMARRLLGKRVACAAGDGDGAWAEYVVAPALQCAPLPADVGDEQGAMSIVNPYTAWAQITIARQSRMRAIIQTTAAGALGRMVIRLGKRRGVQVINIVRRDSQVKALQAIGADYVLNSEAPDFDAQVRELSRQLNARLAFDSLAGSMTGRLLAAMPPHSRVVVYGGLSMEPIQVTPGDLIFNQRSIEGFYLANWVARQRLLTLLSMQRELRGLTEVTHTEIQLRAPLAAGQRAIATYEAQMSAGKVLLIPGMAPD